MIEQTGQQAVKQFLAQQLSRQVPRHECLNPTDSRKIWELQVLEAVLWVVRRLPGETQELI